MPSIYNIITLYKCTSIAHFSPECKELQGKVHAEQEEFRRYLEGVAHKCAEDYKYIHADAHRYIQVLAIGDAFFWQ